MGVLTRADCATRVRRHARSAQGGVGTRRTCERHGAREHRRRRRAVPRARRHDAVREGRPVGRRPARHAQRGRGRQQDRHRASKEQVLAMLGAAAELGAEAYFPVSAQTGEGIDALVAHLVDRLPDGPEVLPRRRVQRHARRAVGRRARPRAAARGDP